MEFICQIIYIDTYYQSWREDQDIAPEIKILSCIHSLNPAGGGPSHFVRELCTLQKQYNYITEIVCFDADNAPWLPHFPAKVYALGPGIINRFGFSFKYLNWLKQNASNYDLIIVHGVWDFACLGLWMSLKNINIPYVVISHGMLDPWFNEAYPFKKIKKIIYWKLFLHHALSKAKAVLFTAKPELILARKSFHPYNINEQVIPYGVLDYPGDTASAQEEFFNEFPQLRNKKFFLFLGRIAPKKGVDILLKAFKKLEKNDYYLVIAGPYSSKKYFLELQKLSQSLGYSNNLIWTGPLTGEKKWGANASADAFVLISHQENFAQAMTESLSVGTPVLISNKINTWQEIEEYKAGLVCEDTVEGAEKILRTWIKMTEKERNAMQDTALYCFAKRFNLEHNIDNLIQLLKQFSKLG